MCPFIHLDLVYNLSNLIKQLWVNFVELGVDVPPVVQLWESMIPPEGVVVWKTCVST
jgi:hypothetical protein